MCSCHSILECCVTVSGVKLSIRSFVLFIYAVMKNLSQLLRSSNSSDGHQQHFYLNCLQGFSSEESRNKHFKYCVDHEVKRIDMPQENSFLRFQGGQYQFNVPF